MAIEADKVVVVLEAQTQAFNAAMKDSARVVEQTTSATEKAAGRAEKAIVASSRKTQTAIEAVVKQVSASGIPLTTNNPLFTLTSTFTGIGESAAGAGGKITALTSLLSFGLGAGVSVATGAIGALLDEILKTGEGTDQLVAKLKKHVQETGLAAEAADIFAKTLEGEREAARLLHEELEKGLKTQEEVTDQTYREAQAHLTNELALRKELAARLAFREQELEALQERANAPGANSDARALGVEIAQRQLDGLRAKIAINDKAVKIAEQNVANILGNIGEIIAQRATDPAKAANDQFDRMVANAKKASAEIVKTFSALDVKARATALGAERRRLSTELAGIETRRNAALKAAQESGRSSGSGQIGRQIGLPEARSIVASVGGTVTSDHRSRAEQERLYQRYLAGQGPLAAKPGTSLHEVDRAVDVGKKAGLTLAILVKAFKDAGVTVAEALDEGSHYHIGFGRKVGNDAGQSAAARAKREAEQLADRRAANEQRFQDSLANYDIALADARKRQVQTAEEAAVAEEDAINKRAAAAAQDIEQQRDKQKRDDAAKAATYDIEAAILLAKNEELRGLNIRNAKEKEQQRLDIERLRLAQGALRDAAEVDQARLDLAETTAERGEIALRLLEIDRQIEIAKIDELLANKELSKAERERLEAQKGRVNTIADLRREGLERQYESPAARYSRSLNLTPEQIRERAEQAAVDELQYLRDGLVDGLTEELGIKDPLIRQLIGMFIDQVIMKPIAQALANATAQGGGGLGGILSFISTGIGSLFGGGGGGLQGAANGANAGLIGMAGGGAIRVNGRGGTDQNVLSINGQKVARVNQGEIINVVPANARAARGGGVTVISAPRFDLSKAVVTPDLYRDMQRISDESAAKAGAAAYNRSIRDAPAAVRQANRFGNR